jgi:phage terminase large subunit
MINLIIEKKSKWRQLYAPDKSIRYVLLYGPRLGGKSYKASQAAMIQMGNWKYFRGYIMRNVLDTVRDSIFQDCVDRSLELKLPYKISDLNIDYLSKNLKGKGFKKSSGKDTAKQKSLAGRNYVLVEEAEEVEKEDFVQLDLSLRTTKGRVLIVLVFNPPEKNHWLIKDFFDLKPNLEHPDFFEMVPKNRDDTAYIFSNYKDNLEYLDQNVVKRAEHLKETDLEYYLHKIVGLVPSGKTGRVFKEYHRISQEEFQNLPYSSKFGLDFGYNDPTTLLEIKVHDRNLYIKQRFYKRGLNIDDICENLGNLEEKIIADSAAKQTIETLNQRGFWIESSKKGTDSVQNGIRKLLKYNIFITEDSYETIFEFENICWKLDKFKLPTDEVEDKNNHAIDAIRYALEEVDNPEINLEETFILI